MTTRGQLKRAVGIDRSDAGRGLATEPLPSLPERLYTARERKGVDLYRAERDTKIRARYLAALERGDYKELPGAVYTKGFLRNYALYLGLDPDEVLLQWRNERGEPEGGAAGHRRAAAHRDAAQGHVVLAGSRRRRAARRRHRRLRRLSRHPGPALRQAADDRGDPAVDRGRRRGRGHDDLHARGHHAARRDRLDPVTRSRGAVPGHGHVGWHVGLRRRPAPRPEPVRRELARPGDRQALGGHDQAVHHRAVPPDRGADADRRPAVRGRLVRERGDPRRRQGDERVLRGRQCRRTSVRRGRVRPQARARRPPHPRHPPRPA